MPREVVDANIGALRSPDREEVVVKNPMVTFVLSAFSILTCLAASNLAAHQFTFPSTISDEAQEAGAAMIRSEEPLPRRQEEATPPT